METVSFLSGVPLALMKKGLFSRKIGAVVQMAKLLWNGKAYDFKAATQGAVALNSTMTDWWFIAPDDRFDFDGFSDMTLGTFLETMITECNGTPIPAWDDFAVWLSEDSTVEQVNMIFSMVSRVECGGMSLPSFYIPKFTAPGGHISGLLNWVLALFTAIGATDVATMSAFRVHSRKYTIPMNVYTTTDDGTESLSMTMAFSFQT